MKKIDFTKQDNVDFINRITDDFNMRNTLFKWNWTADIKEDRVRLYWDYLKGEGTGCFTITYDEEMDFFNVLDEYEIDITEELDDNTDLKRTMYSVWDYARSRY